MMQTGSMDEGFTEVHMKSFSVGLCLTCNNAPDCFFRKRRGADAIYCEMFDNYVPPKGGDGIAVTPALTTEAAEFGKFKGLCVNCAHRNACALSKSEGGIWHCEEYE